MNLLLKYDFVKFARSRFSRFSFYRVEFEATHEPTIKEILGEIKSANKRFSIFFVF